MEKEYGGWHTRSVNCVAARGRKRPGIPLSQSVRTKTFGLRQLPLDLGRGQKQVCIVSRHTKTVLPE